MPGPTAVTDIVLTPLPAKTYFDFDREFREEFIYFLIVDRFHDDTPRSPPPSQPGRTAGRSA